MRNLKRDFEEHSDEDPLAAGIEEDAKRRRLRLINTANINAREVVASLSTLSMAKDNHNIKEIIKELEKSNKLRMRMQQKSQKLPMIHSSSMDVAEVYSPPRITKRAE